MKEGSELPEQILLESIKDNAFLIELTLESKRGSLWISGQLSELMLS